MSTASNEPNLPEVVKAKITISFDLLMQSKYYEECNTVEEMIQVDKENIQTDPTILLEMLETAEQVEVEIKEIAS